MQIVRTLGIGVVAVTAWLQTANRPEVVSVSAVVDGATIVAAGYGRVKLAGITAPRLGRGLHPDAPNARRAKERLEGIVIQRFVRLQFDAGSTRAYVLLEDGRCVNAILAREGLATPEAAIRRSGHPCAAEIGAAGERARPLRRGRLSATRPRGARAAPAWRSRAAPAARSSPAPRRA